MDGIRDDAMDMLAESVIDDVLCGATAERREAVDRALNALAAARREIITADRDLRAWRSRRAFGHSTAMKALQAARVADFTPSAIPPGTHSRAVIDYLKVHSPVWEAPKRTGLINSIRRASTAPQKIASRVLRGLRRKAGR